MVPSVVGVDRTGVSGLGNHASSSSPLPSSDKIRISKIGGRYLVFDVADVARLRRQHSMCAVLVGITPQAPNQSIFSGLPLELTADEVRWLVYDRHVAYVADDRQAHLDSLSSRHRRRAYADNVLRQRQAAQVTADEVAAERERRGAEVRASMATKRAERKSTSATGKAGKGMSTKGDTVPPHVTETKTTVLSEEQDETVGPSNATASTVDTVSVTKKSSKKAVVLTATDRANDHADAEPLLVAPLRIEEIMQEEDSFIFGGRVEEERMKVGRGSSIVELKQKKSSPQPIEEKEKEKKQNRLKEDEPFVRITPTTSVGLLGSSTEETDTEGGAPLLQTSSSPSATALRAHLADRGYYTTPGLRFGGKLSVYPGDPFRYHAHFVATAYEWDEPIPLLDLVGTGRLATGVKKGLLIGGAKPDEGSRTADNVRAFTLEWAAI